MCTFMAWSKQRRCLFLQKVHGGIPCCIGLCPHVPSNHQRSDFVVGTQCGGHRKIAHHWAPTVTRIPGNTMEWCRFCSVQKWLVRQTHTKYVLVTVNNEWCNNFQCLLFHGSIPRIAFFFTGIGGTFVALLVFFQRIQFHDRTKYFFNFDSKPSSFQSHNKIIQFV